MVIMCKLIDTIGIKTCNILTMILSYICCPVKYLLKPITNSFQRPYSFCFLLSYFLLIIPAILLIVLLIQYSGFINGLEGFTSIYYITLANLLVNYVLVFHIYHIYGLHRLEYQTCSFTVKGFLKYTFEYLFRNTKLGFIGVYFIIQIGLGIFAIHYIMTDKGFNDENFDLPILITFSLYAICSNLVFTLGHFVIYLSLLLVLICKINGSCFCGIFSGSRYGKLIDFVERYLDCFKLFGIYDIERGGIELNIINNV
jgi:hypothetical protein